MPCWNVSTRGEQEQEFGSGAGLPAVRRAHPKRRWVPWLLMANGRCRMHGGASPGAPRGEGPGMWKHGLRLAEAIERRRRMTAEMRRIRYDVRELARD
jgi:hypothetical protein